ncbi:MAG TPA: MarR family transcriptional regulator [Spirochaetota bacterium]|nr:MarR family transcriptional regulator [Spirochaetota bacterium]
MKRETQKFDMLDSAGCPYYLITRASLAITAILKKAFAEAGISHVKPAYLGVLMVLWKVESLDEALGKLGSPGGMKTADLGRSAGLEPSTMTGVIDRMERDGLVRREDDPGDRRAQIIRLTDDGGRVRKAVAAAMDAALGEAFEGVSSGALEGMRGVLRKVLVNTDRGSLE